MARTRGSAREVSGVAVTELDVGRNGSRPRGRVIMKRTKRTKRIFAGAGAVAVGTAVSLYAVAQPGAAAGGVSGHGGQGRADVAFTKWVTSRPVNSSTLAGVSMAGVVGGDVGPGHFVGAVTSDDTTSKPAFWLAQALYGFNGSEHSMVAYNFITENDKANPVTARIRGIVTGGWMAGARVSGEYTQLDPCPIPTPGNVFGRVCFQGTLHLRLR